MLDIIPVVAGLCLIAAMLYALLLRGLRLARPTGWARAGCAAGAALAAAAVTFPAVLRLAESRHVQVAGTLVRRVSTTAPLVALTFDDGPTARHAPFILDLLARENVPATFFLNGRDVRSHPEIVRRMIDEGHELGNHTDSHRLLLGVPWGEMRDEVERTDRALRDAGYSGPIHFRPPYGKRLFALPYYLWRTDRTSIFMDVEPESDPSVGASSSRIVRHTLDRVRPGSIVLLHVMYDSREQSRRAVAPLIQSLRDRGYRFVTVSELLAVDEDGRT